MDSSSPALTVREASDSDGARWDAFVDAMPEATFFHRFGWKRVMDRSFGHRTYYLCVERDGAIRGILPLTLLDSRLFGKSLVSAAFGVAGGPVAADGWAKRELTAAAVSLADRLDVDFLEYRCAASDAAPEEGKWLERSDLYVNFRKHLSRDPDANMKSIPRKQRAMVRKGMKAGLESQIDEDVDRLHDIYAASVRNLGTPVFPKKYFEVLKECFGGECEVLTVTHGGRPMSSVMSFYFRDTVLPYYGGGHSEARPLAANDFMYWEVMQRALERGIEVFDFGRSKTGSGAYSFKKNWGFVPNPLSYSYYPRRTSELPDINPNNPKYRLAIAVWKRLPLPVTKIVGPLIARSLG